MMQTEDITDNQKTVVFRKAKESRDVVALLPKVPSATVSGECVAFSAKDGWGSADYEAVLLLTVPAIEIEYGSLLRTMGELGHTLIVRSDEELLALAEAASGHIDAGAQLPFVDHHTRHRV